MSSWNKLRIGRFKCRINKVEKEREKFVDCDEEGNLIRCKCDRRIKKYFCGEREIDKYEVFKLVNGKPRRKLQRTKEVEEGDFEYVNPDELKDMIIETYYVIDCDKLRSEILKKQKIIKFLFTNGNGFKVYESFILPYKKYLIMVLCWGKLDIQIHELLGNYTTLTEKENAYESNVNRSSESEIFDMYSEKIEVKVK